jgi:hypothetical protein
MIKAGAIILASILSLRFEALASDSGESHKYAKSVASALFLLVESEEFSDLFDDDIYLKAIEDLPLPMVNRISRARELARKDGRGERFDAYLKIAPELHIDQTIALSDKLYCAAVLRSSPEAFKRGEEMLEQLTVRAETTDGVKGAIYKKSDIERSRIGLTSCKVDGEKFLDDLP